MARSSNDPSSFSSDRPYMTTPIQDGVSSDDLYIPSVEETRGSVQIRGRGSIANGTLGGVRTLGRGVRTRRRRPANETPSVFGTPNTFEFTSIEDEEGEEEERRGQVQGRGRGRGRPPGRGRGGGRGRGRGRRDEEDAETMVNSRPGTHNTCATNSQERPENGYSFATNCNGVGNALAQSQINEGGTTSGNIATIDNTNMLKCRVCSETLDIPIYQCFKGHTACSSCWLKLENKCPSWCSLVGNIRNLGLEEVLKAVKITCLNSKYGCKEKVSYIMKREHEQSCAYEPCYCPFPRCGFYGSYKDLYLHFTHEHPTSATRFKFDSSFPVHIVSDMKYVFLQEHDHTLFILNYGVQTSRNVANVICMGPSSLQNEYSYELEASRVHSSVKYTSLALSLPKWTVGLPEESGLVDQNFVIDSSWDDKIQVCIRRKGEE